MNDRRRPLRTRAIIQIVTFKAQVRNGRIVLDEPTTLPEGTEIELMPVSDVDDLDDDERERLEQALADSEEDIKAGRVRPVAEFLAEIRADRRQP